MVGTLRERSRVGIHVRPTRWVAHSRLGRRVADARDGPPNTRTSKIAALIYTNIANDGTPTASTKAATVAPPRQLEFPSSGGVTDTNDVRRLTAAAKGQPNLVHHSAAAFTKRGPRPSPSCAARGEGCTKRHAKRTAFRPLPRPALCPPPSSLIHRQSAGGMHSLSGIQSPGVRAGYSASMTTAVRSPRSESPSHRWPARPGNLASRASIASRRFFPAPSTIRLPPSSRATAVNEDRGTALVVSCPFVFRVPQACPRAADAAATWEVESHPARRRAW